MHALLQSNYEKRRTCKQSCLSFVFGKIIVINITMMRIYHCVPFCFWQASIHKYKFILFPKHSLRLNGSYLAYIELLWSPKCSSALIAIGWYLSISCCPPLAYAYLLLLRLDTYSPHENTYVLRFLTHLPTMSYACTLLFLLIFTAKTLRCSRARTQS